MKTSLILSRTSNQPIFSQLFGGNFCEQKLVLGKLLNTVKWSTFCVVSFACSQSLAGYSVLKSLKSIIRNFQCAIWNGSHKSSHILILYIPLIALLEYNRRVYAQLQSFIKLK